MKVKIDKDFEEIIPNYLSNRELDISQLNKFIESNNLKEIEVIAHKLAGSAGSYGFDELGVFAKELEVASQQKNLSRINTLFSSIKKYIETLEIDYVDLD